MTRTISGAILLAAVMTVIAGCDAVVQKATGQYMKMKMIEICGEDDKACVAAVNAQYDSCESKYKNEWSAYMKASSSEEDTILDDYMAKLLTCVVDKDGNSYFEYNTDKPDQAGS